MVGSANMKERDLPKIYLNSSRRKVELVGTSSREM